MSQIVAAMPSNLVKALDALTKLGLRPPEPNSAAVSVLLSKLAEIDEPRAAVVARTLVHQTTFDTLVSQQVARMDVGERYKDITQGFDGIIADAKRLVDQEAAGGVGVMDRVRNVIMKVGRGDIGDRFDAIRDKHDQVTSAVGDAIQRERTILDAYSLYRISIKEAEVVAHELLDLCRPRLEKATADLAAAMAAVEGMGPGAERSRLELAREDARKVVGVEEDRFEIAKNLAEDLSQTFNVSEVTMTRLAQMHQMKDRIFKRSVSFFSTNSTVLSALKVAFTGAIGLREGALTIEAMREGTSRALETLADIGGKVQQESVRAGYGPGIRADAVAKLVDATVQWQTDMRTSVEKMREEATTNSEAIRASVEDGRRRLAQLELKATAIESKPAA